MNELPQELLVHIFTYFTQPDSTANTFNHYYHLLDVLYVCKTWRSAISSPHGLTHLYHTLYLNTTSQVCDNFIELIVNNSNSLKYFQKCHTLIMDRNFDTNASKKHILSRSSLQRLFAVMVSLKHLEFRYISSDNQLFSASDFVIAAVSTKGFCKSLEHLSFLMTDVKDCHVDTICSHLKTLKELNLWGNWNITTIEPCTKLSLTLESLEIGGFGINIDSKTFQRHISSMSKLKKLNIRRCHTISTGHLTSLPTSIEYLDVGFCPQIIDMCAISDRLTKLKHLHMIRAGNKTTADNIHRIGSLIHLESLNLRDINMSGEVLVKALKPLTNLRSLDLENCSNISPDALLESFKDGLHTRLNSINLFDCFHVDDTVMIVLSQLPLRSLVVTIPRVTDEGILKAFCNTNMQKTLRKLEMYSPKKISNVGFLWLTEQLQLESFVFAHSNRQSIDETALVNLPKFQQNIQYLDLTAFADISYDSIIDYIAPLKKLETLRVQRCINQDTLTRGMSKYYTTASVSQPESIPIQASLSKILPHVTNILV